MAGEMSRSDLTPDGDWGLFVRAAGMLEGAEICPFDVYQGPYVRYAGHKFWFTDNNCEGDESEHGVWDETTETFTPLTLWNPWAFRRVTDRELAGVLLELAAL